MTKKDDNQDLQRLILQAITDLREELRDFKAEVNRRFDDVNQRFEQVDKRFEQADANLRDFKADVNQRFVQVDKRFEQVDKRFEQIETEIRHGFDWVRNELAEIKAEVREEKRKLQSVYDSRDQVKMSFSSMWAGASFLIAVVSAVIARALV
jgi:chromosome segregation ATPase